MYDVILSCFPVYLVKICVSAGERGVLKLPFITGSVLIFVFDASGIRFVKLVAPLYTYACLLWDSYSHWHSGTDNKV